MCACVSAAGIAPHTRALLLLLKPAPASLSAPQRGLQDAQQRSSSHNDLSIGEDAGCPVHTRALLMFWLLQGLYAEVAQILTLLYNTAALHGHFTEWLKHQQNISSRSLNELEGKKNVPENKGVKTEHFTTKNKKIHLQLLFLNICW